MQLGSALQQNQLFPMAKNIGKSLKNRRKQFFRHSNKGWQGVAPSGIGKSFLNGFCLPKNYKLFPASSNATVGKGKIDRQLIHELQVKVGKKKEANTGFLDGFQKNSRNICKTTANTVNQKRNC